MTAISKISHLTATGTRPDELGQSAWNQCRGGNLVGYRMPNQPRHRMKDGPHCQSGVEFSVRPQTASSCRVSRLSEKPSPIRRLRINAAPTLTALFDAPDHMLNGASIDNVERRARLLAAGLHGHSPSSSEVKTPASIMPAMLAERSKDGVSLSAVEAAAASGSPLIRLERKVGFRAVEDELRHPCRVE
jgi:hypothetical protein